MIITIITGLLALSMFILIVFGLVKKWESRGLISCILVLMYSLVLCFSDLGYKQGIKHASIDALNGKFHYKIEIKYVLQDSIYVPIDTTYIKIK
jgi:hypothetical protein